jgi:hypothetical protein
MTTKLEELKAAYEAARTTTWDAVVAAWAAYKAELKKQENSND